jgi:hypothetical protein
LRPILREGAGIAPPAWREMEGLLDWTMGTWYPLLTGGIASSLGALRAAGPTTGSALARRARSAILAVNSAPEASVVGAWWSAALVEGLIPRSQRHEVTTLHLSLMAEAVFRRQAARAARALGFAIASGFSLAALPAWGWFARAVLRAVMRRSDGRRAQPMARAQIVESLQSDGQHNR